MTDNEIKDNIYPLYIALDNNLLTARERTRRMEETLDREALSKERDGLYEIYNHVEFVLQKLFLLSQGE